MDSGSDPATGGTSATDNGVRKTPVGKKPASLFLGSRTPREHVFRGLGFSQDSVFSPALHVDEDDPHQTMDRLQSKVSELQSELYRRRISLNLNSSSPLLPNTIVMERSVSDLVTWKDQEIVAIQQECAALKTVKDQKEAELNASLEEIAKLKGELNASRAFKRDAERVETLDQEVRELTEKLKTEVERGKQRDEEIAILTSEKKNLLAQLKLLEAEVDSEKQQSGQIRDSLSEMMKQLLASKALCESDLAALQSQHLRLMTDSAKVEQNLRAQLEGLLAECRALKAKQEFPPEYEDLQKELDAKEKQCAALTAKAGTLEDKLIQISSQAAEERKQHFDHQNLLTQDNEVLKNEIETMRKQVETETRDFDFLRRQLESCELRLKEEPHLREEIGTLQTLVSQRDIEIRNLLVTIEEMKINERLLIKQRDDAESHSKERSDAEKSQEAEFICKLTREKLEAERCVFEEIEKRARAEERNFETEQELKQNVEENIALRAQVDILDKEIARLTRRPAKRHSFQVEGSGNETFSPLKVRDRLDVPLFPLTEVGEGTPQVTETHNTAFPDPAKPSQRSTKESLSSSPCSCAAW